MEAVVTGADGKEIKLTKKIIMDTICKGMPVSDTDIVQFLTLCQVNQLNPFVRDAYLIKYKDAPAQMIVSKEAFMKRADMCPDFEGIESGVVAMNGDGVLQEFNGALMPPTWTLVGGWAKVYRKGRKPYVNQVAFSEYNKGKSTWAAMPLTMIKKVAEVQALREAFPNQLGQMYVRDEMRNIQDADAVEIKEEAAQVVEAPKTEAVAVPTTEAPKAEAPKETKIEGPGF